VFYWINDAKRVIAFEFLENSDDENAYTIGGLRGERRHRAPRLARGTSTFDEALDKKRRAAAELLPSELFGLKSNELEPPSIAIEKAGVHLAQDSPLSSEAGATATFPLAILMASERLTEK